ncbi:hypothetical protein BH20VER2_BH20VER2_16020 [soil metagenome]
MGKGMSVPTTPADLLDLKLMPAWVNEPAGGPDYSNYSGEEEQPFGRERRGPQRGREDRPRGPRPQGRRDDRKPRDGQRPERRPERRGGEAPRQHQQPREAPPPLPQVGVRFLPHAGAFESVIAQIKSSTVTYSVFALARLFLEKPERYEVRLTSAEGGMLHQLGENGPVAADQRVLENGAFAAAKDDFYTVETTQTEPIKGNFTNVARCRLSGTLLGPTNHHSYQPQLRSLYEQRFSRRMSFPDYQRQIDIVSDPAVVEQWKEQARSVTTYVAKDTDPPVTFGSVAEAERHFRQMHLPSLLKSAPEMTIRGVVSRRLPDRGLGRVIEDAWSAEVRSPSKMMAELAGGLRNAGLNIFRHRKGMLFVSPVRLKLFAHERTSVSSSINAILQALSDAPGLNRKQLVEKLASAGAEQAELERIKLSLASDLRWLASEGYIIEFNDGTLDLPRPKPAAAQREAKQKGVTTGAAASGGAAAEATTASAASDDAVAAEPAAATEEAPSATTDPQTGEVMTTGVAPTPPATADRVENEAAAEAPAAPREEIGMSVEQSVEPMEKAEAPSTEAADEQVPSPS